MSSEKTPWYKEEHRNEDPERKGLPVETHAGRALDRFTWEDFDKTTTEDFTGGSEIKKVLAGFLENIEINLDISQNKVSKIAKALRVPIGELIKD